MVYSFSSWLRSSIQNCVFFYTFCLSKLEFRTPPLRTYGHPSQFTYTCFSFPGLQSNILWQENPRFCDSFLFGLAPPLSGMFATESYQSDASPTPLALTKEKGKTLPYRTHWAVPRLAEAKVPTSQAFSKPHQESQYGFNMRCFGSPRFLHPSTPAGQTRVLQVIVLRCWGIHWRDGTRVLGLASGEFIFILLRRLLQRATPRDKERIWYHNE